LHIDFTIDDTSVVIGPGDSYVYSIFIPCDHAAGVHWYHSHHHGAITHQVNGGAYGAIIVLEDDSDVLDSELLNYTFYMELPTRLVVIHCFIVSLYEETSEALGDSTWSVTGDLRTMMFFMVNGIHWVQIDMVYGEWERWKMLNVNPAKYFNLILDTCEFQLFAKDGVYLKEVPRSIDSLYFGPASRAEVAVRCWNDTTMLIHTIDDTYVLAYISVYNSTSYNESESLDLLPSWHPDRPWYLRDLQDESLEARGEYVSDYFWVNMTSSAINGQSFESDSVYLHSIEQGMIQEWFVS
jgi:FtsP/CotA-like multicopper oxidase with cupredoxin domain